MTPHNLPTPTPFDTAQSWPKPDMSILFPVLPPAPVLSPEEIGWIFGPWAPWIKTAAKVKGAPLDYVALGLLVAASSLIGNTRWASPWNGWEEPTVIWGMLVGNPSAGKSPALDVVMKPLSEIEAALAETYAATLSAWEGKNQIAKIISSEWKSQARKAVAKRKAAPEVPAAADAGTAPLRERVWVNDTTTEKMAELMSQTSRSLLSFRDELSGWLDGMDRYSDGGDRPFWLESYGGRAFTVDRKSSPQPILVDRLSVAVLGGIQPEKLSELVLKMSDDGLLARFLVVFPQPLPVTRPIEKLDAKAIKRAFERLHALPPAQDDAGKPKPWIIPFDDDAANELQAFRVQCQEWETEAEGKYKGHIGKLPGMVVRVACVLAHLDWAALENGLVSSRVSEDHVRRSRRLVGDHCRLHAQRAYGTEGTAQEVRAARSAASLIHAEQLSKVSAREIQRKGWKYLNTAQAIHAALGFLEELGWVRNETEETGGRPRRVYLANPRLWADDVSPPVLPDTPTKPDRSPPNDLLSGSVPLSVELPPLPPLPPVLSDKTPEK